MLNELYYGKENLMPDFAKKHRKRMDEILEKEAKEDDLLREKEKGEEKPMINDAKVKKVKPKRFHVDLSPEMGQDLSDLAEKMGLTLNAVVKLFLMENWMKYNTVGFDYIYLGVADRPKSPGEIPF